MKEDKDVRVDQIYKGKSRILVCHIMHEKQEVAHVKTKVFSQEFTWNKRMWAIDNSAIWTDKKGINHAHFDVNYSDGQYHLRQLAPERTFINECIKCSNKIGIDAQNVRDMLKRKTVSAYWGLDQSHIMIILIAMIGIIILAGVLVMMYGDNQKLQAQIIKQTAQTAQFLIGVNLHV